MVVESELTNVNTKGGICTASIQQQDFLLVLGEIMNECNGRYIEVKRYAPG